MLFLALWFNLVTLNPSTVTTRNGQHNIDAIFEFTSRIRRDAAPVKSRLWTFCGSDAEGCERVGKRQRSVEWKLLASGVPVRLLIEGTTATEGMVWMCV